MQPSIVVVGSINIDIVNQVAAHPKVGETIRSQTTTFHPGGKGANQAVAAARAGGRVHMVGAVGGDQFGTELKASLTEAGVITEYVTGCARSTGMAFITVDEAGANGIIISEGANAEVNKEQVDAVLQALYPIDAVLLQNEIPFSVTAYAIEAAHTKGIPVFLNAAPGIEVPDVLLQKIDLLITNELETQVITGLPVTDQRSAHQATASLIERHVRQVVITMGEQGAMYSDRDGRQIFQPAFRVQAVDTTSAGDTFVGALAVAVCSSMEMEAALAFAAMAAALAVTKTGAQPSIPTLREIQEFAKGVPSAMS